MTTDKLTSKYAIVRKALELMNLGDVGKSDSFISKVIKEIKSTISDLNFNKERLKFNYNREESKLRGELEDAEDNVIAAYSDIDPKKLTTNSSQADYVKDYLSKLTKAELEVKAITLDLAKLEEKYDETLSKLDEEISTLQGRLKIIEQES